MNNSLLILSTALLVIAGVPAQDVIDQNFETIRTDLERGLLLQINLELQLCEVTGRVQLQDNLFISMPMRQWQLETFVDENGETIGKVIRVEDWYLNAGVSRLAVITRAVLISDDGSVTMQVSFVDFDGGTAEFTLGCQLGRSAIVHGFGNEQTPMDYYYTYAELKAGLLLGRHIEAVGLFHRCLNADDYLAPGAEYFSGFRIQNLAVVNDGTPDEFMAFSDTGVYYFNGTLASLGEDVLVYRNGSVFVSSGLFDNSDWSVIISSQLHCIVADSMKFSSYQREQDGSYVTYAQITEAAFRGHDMEAVVFPGLCHVTSGPEVPVSIGVRRFDQVQLFEAGGLWGPLEYLAFSSYHLHAGGQFATDVVRVYEDNKLTLGYGLFDVPTGNLTTGEIQCDLGSSSLFHSIKRQRRPVTRYRDLVDAIIDEGAIFEVVVDFTGCETGDFDLASTYAGVLWETYVNDARGDRGYFYGVSFALATNPSGGLAWDVAAFTMLPDRSVFINVHLYDFTTGEDVFPPRPDIVCKLHQGGPDGDGSVYFFRYP